VPRGEGQRNSRAVNAEGKYNTKRFGATKTAKTSIRTPNYYVGGNTKFYGAALFRLRQQDFVRSATTENVAGWPIAYEISNLTIPEASGSTRARTAR